MTTISFKEKVLQSVQEMPQDIGIEDIMEHLYFLYKIEQGLKQVEANDVISHQDAKQNFKQWHK
jgi:hypothetical protein